MWLVVVGCALGLALSYWLILFKEWMDKNG